MKKAKAIFLIGITFYLFSLVACTHERIPSSNPNGKIEREEEPDEYPKTEIVPGFTLDEPDEPVD